MRLTLCLFKDLFSSVIVFILCISPKPYLFSPHVCFIDLKTKRRLAHPLTLKTKVKVSNYADAQEVNFLLLYLSGSFFLNPVRPKNDHHQISPCNINALR